MDVEYLVISGGGPLGVRYLGALQQARAMGKWKQDKIKGVYATSIGSVIGAFICLDHDDETINKYIVERPWKDVFKITPSQIFDAYSTKGVLDENIFEVILKPLLDAKGLSVDITLEQFYQFSQIELTIFAVNLNTYELISFSRTTHPEWKLVRAIAASCALPGLFKPVIVENACFIDGGFKCNYPLKICLEETKCHEEQVLGVSGCLEGTNTNTQNEHSGYNGCEYSVTDGSTMMDFVIAIFVNSIAQNDTNKTKIYIKNQIWCVNDGNSLSLDNLNNTVRSSEARRKLIMDGIEDAKNTFVGGV